MSCPNNITQCNANDPCASVSKRGLVQNLSYENKFDFRENEPVGGTHFHMNGFAIRLVLTQRQQATQKWSNRPRSIYQYSNIDPRLSGQNCKFFKFPLSFNSQKRLGYKENTTKHRSLS